MHILFCTMYIIPQNQNSKVNAIQSTESFTKSFEYKLLTTSSAEVDWFFCLFIKIWSLSLRRKSSKTSFCKIQTLWKIQQVMMTSKGSKIQKSHQKLMFNRNCLPATMILTDMEFGTIFHELKIVSNVVFDIRKQFEIIVLCSWQQLH